MQYIPEEGLDHPVFARFLPFEALEIVLSLDMYIDPPVEKLLHELINLWTSKVDWDHAGKHHEKGPKFFFEAKDNVLHLGISLVEKPVPAAKNLLEILSRSPIEVTEVILLKRKISDSGKMGQLVESEEVLQQKAYAHPEHWWQASFDENLAPPLSQSPNPIKTWNGRKIQPIKLMRPNSESYRIVYGLILPNRLSPSKYTKRMGNYLLDVLEEELPSPTLKISSRKAPERGISLITHRQRQGYAFSLSAAPLIVHYPHGTRFREHELMLSMRKIIQELHLAKVIHWKRTATEFQFHLWENWTYH